MGKWSVIYDHGWHVVDDSDTRFGGQIVICDCGVDPWSEMNSRLIAAAPELAAVLLELAECSQYWSEYDVPLGIHDRIKAALEKAGVE